MHTFLHRFFRVLVAVTLFAGVQQTGASTAISSAETADQAVSLFQGDLQSVVGEGGTTTDSDGANTAIILFALLALCLQALVIEWLTPPAATPGSRLWAKAAYR